MLSQAALESLYSATYVEDYMDGIENLPDDVQRMISQILELNVTLRPLIEELESNMSYLMENMGHTDSNVPEDKKRKLTYKRVQQILMLTQDIGDEKLQLGQQIQDFMENKVQQLNLDKKNIDLEKRQLDVVQIVRESKSAELEERPVKRVRRARHEVFVPSILGPATLEPTSFSQISEMPNTSSATVSSFLSSEPTKSQSLTNPQTSPIRIKKEDPDTFAKPRSNKSEAQWPLTSPAAQPSSTESVASTSSKAAAGSAKVNASRSLTFGSGNEVSIAKATTPTPMAVDLTAVKVEKEEVPSEGSSTHNQPSGSNKEYEWKSKACGTTKKDKRGKKRRSSTKQPVNIPIDPDEPLYCLCDQISFGEMIGCDNDLCPIEWFHFSCVSLTTKPKGKWFCPKCRGDRQNVMKPKAVFLKELAIYNRLKEESN